MKRKYAQIKRKLKCSALMEGGKRRKTKMNSKYKNRVGAKAQRLQKVKSKYLSCTLVLIPFYLCRKHIKDYSSRAKESTRNQLVSIYNNSFCLTTTFLIHAVPIKRIYMLYSHLLKVIQCLITSHLPSSTTIIGSRKRKRCGSCSGCHESDDCGTCSNCLDKVKFGGSGKKKQGCKKRKCMFYENNTKRLMIELLYLGSGYETDTHDNQRMQPRAFAQVLRDSSLIVSKYGYLVYHVTCRE